MACSEICKRVRHTTQKKRVRPWLESSGTSAVCEDNLFWSGRKASRPAKLYESQRIPKTTVIFFENTGYTLALTRRLHPCNKIDNFVSSRIHIMLHGNSERCHAQDSKLKPLQLIVHSMTLAHGSSKH
jgi:hypothetical protein